MPEISEDQFRALAEIQHLGRVMKRCASVNDPAFHEAQAALAQALNRLASLPTVQDRTGLRSGGIEV